MRVWERGRKDDRLNLSGGPFKGPYLGLGGGGEGGGEGVNLCMVRWRGREG